MNAEKKINNLVIGSSGFVGEPFCRYLEEIGEGVVRFDVKNGEEEDARFENLPLDGIDRVYFLAWEVGGAKYLYRKDVQFLQLDWNLKLLLNVMPQLKDSGIPFLFVSSQLAEEYDTVYGATKRLGEIWTNLLDQGVRVRLWNVYGGIEEVNEKSHVVADFIHQAIYNNEIKMLTTGEEQRQFIYVDDVCSGFHSALSGGYKGVYDVTSFEWIKVIDLANVIASVTGAKVTPGDKIGSTPITPLQGKIPGWHAKVPIEEGITNMVNKIKSLAK